MVESNSLFSVHPYNGVWPLSSITGEVTETSMDSSIVWRRVIDGLVVSNKLYISIYQIKAVLTFM